MSDTLKTLMTAFVAGDRDGAASAAKEALDKLIHDFLFPEDADQLAGMADVPAMGDVAIGDPLATDPSLNIGVDDHSDLDADPDLMGAGADELDALGSMGSELGGDADLGAEVDLGGDDLDLEFESVEDLDGLGADDEEQLGGGDALDLDGLGTDMSLDTDADLDSLSGELDGATASDITDISAEPGDGLGGEAKSVVDVVVDPEQGDDMVKAIKIVYSDGTDLTFFTLASEVEKVTAAMKDMTANSPELSGDELVAELAQSHQIY